MALATGSAAVKGGFWPENGITTLTPIGGWGAGRRRAASSLDGKGQLALRTTMVALDGVVAGSAAVKTLSRIEANSELGGKRTIETETLINSNTTAGDVTIINRDILSFSTRTYTASPVVNKDGNPLGTR